MDHGSEMKLSYSISRLKSEDSAAWDNYVANNPGGSFFHLSGWRTVLEAALGHQTHYVIAKGESEIVGVLPLVHVKSFLSGSNLSSLAFGSYGGAIADNDDIRDALERYAVELGHELNVGSVEFRYLESTGKARPIKNLYERFVKPICADEEENMQAIRGKQRNVIRKGIKNGLELHVDTCTSFYETYAESVRNLGTPVFPRKLFESLTEVFSDSTEVLTVSLDGTAISSAIVYYHGNEVCPYYWGGKFAARSLKANDVLAWKIMCRAAERGCTSFDFGRSKRDTGSYQWKLNLGFEPIPLSYEYELINDGQIPEVNPSNPKYKLFIDVWKRLPLSVSKIVGPVVSRGLG